MSFKNKKNPKISIITVCYNSEKTIKKTLDSVKNQTLKNIEHLIIDGKSIDNTISIVKKFSHVKKIISEPDRGLYYAMNKGLKIASGDIIGFLNSDDFYATNKVLRSVAKLFYEDPTLEACYADLVYVNRSNTSKIIRYWKSGTFRYGAFSEGWNPPHPTFFVKRSIYLKNGNFDVKYRIASDAELMMRFLEVKKIKVKYISKIWVKFRLGGLSNSGLKNIYEQNYEILKALKKHKLPSNFIYFFYKKLVIKLKEFILRP
tara:strand:+ start:3097 stop:3876 length:780 start_codon:yes stop_codon:yes gene_type:complete